MTDGKVAITTVVSGVLWTLGTLVVIAGVVSRIYGIPAFGLLLAGVGGVLNMRGFVMRCEQQIRNAFECGRDYERGHVGADVQRLR